MEGTGGSLPLAVFMLSSINQTKDLVSSRVPRAADPWGLSHSPIAWLTVAVLWIGAGHFLVQLHRTRRRTAAEATTREARTTGAIVR